ncbi:MAG: hypothetical protein JWO46_1911 [Nocardioidaceae bacterium]|nr:hypothetical protein [Nocardioidaceae bacterium]
MESPRRDAPAAESQQQSVSPRRPWTIVAWTLALLIVLPLVVAAVMSMLDDRLRGNEVAARIVVSLVVLGVLAVAVWFVRRP